jgi:large subunit ribosomal protein L16
MLMPKKTKYRKAQRGRMRGLSKGARTLAFGDFGLVAVEPHWVTSKQIESIRVTISRQLKKVGQLHLRMFPDKPISKKPAETRMGKGKGNPEFWVSVVKRGRIIVELGGGLTELEAKEILRLAAYKLPLKTRFVTKADFVSVENKSA